MKFSLAVLTAALLGSSASAQDNETETAAETILDIVVNSPGHTTLETAVLAADASIAALLNDTDAETELTLFAPDDAAFDNVPTGTIDLLLTTPWVQHLNCVLLGHVFTGGAVASTDVTEPTSVDSALGAGAYALNLTIDDSVVAVNGVPVSGPDITASNGVVHSLTDGVLLPPCVTDNLATVAGAAPALSQLLELVTLAGGDLLDALTGAPAPDGLTVLAPTDEAFAAVDPQVMAYLAANVDELVQVLQYHIVPTNYDGVDLGEFPTLLAGETIDVGLDGDALTINDVATVTTANILASNGVVHLIDAILLPASVTANLPGQEPDDTNTTDPADDTNMTMPETNMTAPETNMTMPETNMTDPETNMTMPETNMTMPEMASTLLEVIAGSEPHSTLKAAVEAADASMAALLSDDTQELTVFAPDDSAFALLPAGTVERLVSPAWKQHLDCLLMGHVYGEGAVESGSLSGDTTVASLAPMFDLELEVKDDGTVTVNDIPVAAADIPASNGVIHSLSDGVLLPDCVRDNLVDVLSDREDFKDLVKLAATSGLVDSFDQTPTGEGITVLVPTNTALGEIDSVVLAGLVATNVEAVADILEYHILPANFDGKTEGSFTTQQGEAVQVKRMRNGKLMINCATVVEENILASNGVIQVLDTILIPPSLAGTPGLPDVSDCDDDDHSGHDHGEGGGEQGTSDKGGSSSMSASGAAEVAVSGLVATALAGVAALAL